MGGPGSFQGRWDFCVKNWGCEVEAWCWVNSVEVEVSEVIVRAWKVVADALRDVNWVPRVSKWSWKGQLGLECSIFSKGRGDCSAVEAVSRINIFKGLDQDLKTRVPAWKGTSSSSKN